MRQLAPRGHQLALRGSPREGKQRLRDRVDNWRRWYKTTEWRALRWEVLVQEHFTCRRCETIGESRDLVADHVEPHRGDRDLFFARANLQCLCATCHNRDKQREERRSLG